MSVIKKLLMLQAGQFNFKNNYTLDILGNRDSKPPFDGKMYTPNEIFAYNLSVKNEVNLNLINVEFLKGHTVETFDYNLKVKDDITGVLVPN